MKRLSKRIILVVGAVTVAGSALAFTHHHKHHSDKRADWVVKIISHELTLDETQITKLENTKNTLMAIGKKMHSSRQETHNDILELLASDTLDQNKILSMINEKTAEIQTEAPNLISALGEFYDSLNTEQRQILKEHITDKMDHIEHHSKKHKL